MLHLFKGDWGKAHFLIEQWINTRRTLDVAVLLPWAVASSTWAVAAMGDANEALSRLREAERLLDQQTARGIVGHRSWGYYAASRACLLAGRVDAARRLGLRSLESSRRQPGFRAHALRLLGDLAAHPDQFDAETGAAHYNQAMELAQTRGMRPVLAHCHLGLSELCRRSGKPERAREHLSAATAMFSEMNLDFPPQPALEARP
jgi:tetratricopeptide (TPR) repeat protein